MQISLATLTELEQIYCLQKHAYSQWSPVQLKTRIDNQQIWMALENQNLIAYLAFQALFDELELLNIVVSPNYRNQGVAKQLMDKLFALALEAGKQACILDVAVDNQAALRLYQQYGFVEEGRRKNYYHKSQGQAVDALLMRKIL